MLVVGSKLWTPARPHRGVSLSTTTFEPKSEAGDVRRGELGRPSTVLTSGPRVALAPAWRSRDAPSTSGPWPTSTTRDRRGLPDPPAPPQPGQPASPGPLRASI